MKLRHITFTGIDANTDLQELQAIQQQYPLAEFGVLTSYHWNENGNRYLDPKLINNLRGSGLHLSLHICGRAAHDAAVGDWEKIDVLTLNNLDIFKRIQLNLSRRKDNPEFCWIPLVIGQELIVQQKGCNNLTLYENTLKHWKKNPYVHRDTISVLLDASGGQGIDTPINILGAEEKVGYAGGISPNNVADKLIYLFENVYDGEFWIDMESGVRTNDWFDTAKVRRVLEICEPIIKEYDNENSISKFKTN